MSVDWNSSFLHPSLNKMIVSNKQNAQIPSISMCIRHSLYPHHLFILIIFQYVTLSNPAPAPVLSVFLISFYSLRLYTPDYTCILVIKSIFLFASFSSRYLIPPPPTRATHPPPPIRGMKLPTPTPSPRQRTPATAGLPESPKRQTEDVIKKFIKRISTSFNIGEKNRWLIIFKLEHH